MKKIFLFILIITTHSMYAWDGTIASSYSGGDGSEAHPYEIASAEELALLAQRTNQQLTGDSVLHYVLTQDIDLLCIRNGDTLSWTPIGIGPASAEDDRPMWGWKYFQGVFDGNNHTISNLYLRTDSTCVGLFGAAINTSFRNLRMVGTDISTTGGAIGALCGLLGYNSNVTNIVTEQGKVDGYSAVGGIVGLAKSYYHIRYSEYQNDNIYLSAIGSITHCLNGNDVKTNKKIPTSVYNLDGGDRLGGICGGLNGYDNQGYVYFAYCDNYGAIRGFHNFGGIVGRYFMTYGVSNVTMIEYCNNYGQITPLPFEYEDNDNVGCFAGICGMLTTSSGSMGIIRACVNLSDIICERGLSNSYSTGYCGGVVGLNQGTVTQCCNVGKIRAYGFTGGICGRNEGVVTDCLNGGVCEYKATQGICGYNNATVLRSVNTNFANSSLSKVNRETMGNAHFDKQMFWINPTTSYRHFTREMLGEQLKWALGDQWVYTEGMYPRPALLAETDAAYVAATPVLLEEYHYDPTNELPYDYTRNIQNCKVKLGKGEGVSWEIENPFVNDTTYAFIDKDSLFVHGTYDVSLIARKGRASRKIPLLFKNPECTCEQPQDSTSDNSQIEEPTTHFWYDGWLYLDVTQAQMDSIVGGEVVVSDTLDFIFPILPSRNIEPMQSMVSYHSGQPFVAMPMENLDSITYSGDASVGLQLIVPVMPSTSDDNLLEGCVGSELSLTPQPMDSIVKGQWYVWENKQWVEVETDGVLAKVVVDEEEKMYQFRGYVMGDNLITNGDFENGVEGFETDYQIVLDAPDNLGPEGTVVVASDIGYIHGDSNCNTDHTMKNGLGKMLAVNGNTEDAMVAYRCRINNIKPHTDYALSTWASNWSHLAIALRSFAQLKFCINGQQVGDMFIPTKMCDWERFYEVWNSGNNSEIVFTIQDVLTESQGNDFSLDDVFFAELQPIVYTIRVAPLECP